jgi:ribonuclease HI
MVEENRNPKDLKTRVLKKLLDERKEKITLLWVNGHMGNPGNEAADKETKVAQEIRMMPTESTHCRTL